MHGNGWKKINRPLIISLRSLTVGSPKGDLKKIPFSFEGGIFLSVALKSEIISTFAGIKIIINNNYSQFPFLFPLQGVRGQD